MSPELYRNLADQLKYETFKLAGFVSVNLPDSVSSDPQLAHLGGSAVDSSVMQAIARQIDVVLWAFGELEECLGLPPEPYSSRFEVYRGDRTTIAPGGPATTADREGTGRRSNGNQGSGARPYPLPGRPPDNAGEQKGVSRSCRYCDTRYDENGCAMW
jgi:hypothetical protein